MSLVTEMDEIVDIKIEKGGDLENIMLPARRRSFSTLTIPKTERWIQGTQVGGNINYLSNLDATKDINEVPAVRTRKQTKNGLAYSLEILFDRRERLLLRWKVKHELRVASSNPRVTSSNLRVTSSNSQVTSSNLRVTSSNPRVTSSNPRVRRLKARWEIKSTR